MFLILVIIFILLFIICRINNKINIYKNKKKGGSDTRFSFKKYYSKSLKYNLQKKIKIYEYTIDNFIKKIKNVECCKFTNYNKNMIDFNIIKKKLGHLNIYVKSGDYNNVSYGNFSKTFWKDNSYKTTIKDFINNIIEKNIDIKNIPYAGNILISEENIKKLFGKTFTFPYFTNVRKPKFWLSKKNTITKLHRDTADNLIIQIYGIKKWIIYPLNLQKYLYYTKTLPQQNYSSQRSQVNIKKPDLNKYPLFKHIKNYKLEIMMYPGDLLYLPLGWGHEVETITDSIMFNYWADNPRSLYDNK